MAIEPSNDTVTFIGSDGTTQEAKGVSIMSASPIPGADTYFYIDSAGVRRETVGVAVVTGEPIPGADTVSYLDSTGKRREAVGVAVLSGGVPSGDVTVGDGDPITVEPFNETTASYTGTAQITGGILTVVLPTTVGMVPADGPVGVWNASDDDRGNGSAFVNEGYLTAVRLPPQNDVVGNGASVIVSKADNTGLLAMGVANVPAETNTFQNVALPATAAVVSDQETLTVPVTGTYTTGATVTIVDNAITAIALS